MPVLVSSRTTAISGSTRKLNNSSCEVENERVGKLPSRVLTRHCINGAGELDLVE